MKIIELKAKNIKRLKAVEIKPKGNVVIISGKNDQGKSSVIDAIWLALKYADVSKEIVHPIREGEKKASVSLRLRVEKTDNIAGIPEDIKEMIVTRHWTGEDKSYLKVEAGENFYTTAPQKLVNTFIGAVGFDPLEFARMKEREQRNLLLNLINLEVDLDELENQKRNIYDERTVIGRELKRAEAKVDYEFKSEYPDVEEVSLVELTERLEKQLEDNRRIKSLRAEAKGKLELVERMKDEIKGLKKTISEYMERIDEIAMEVKRIMDENAGIDDIGLMRLKIERAEKINSEVRKRKQNEEFKKVVEELSGEYGEKTMKIKKLENEKKKALSDTVMPIEGLGITEEGVTYKGYPFKDLSDSEKLKVSLAIMMALKPKLRLITIKDGSLLDDENMKVIEEMVNKEDFQVLIEKVDDTGKVGFYIEDGTVRKVN